MSYAACVQTVCLAPALPKSPCSGVVWLNAFHFRPPLLRSIAWLGARRRAHAPLGCMLIPGRSSSAVMEALRRKKDFVGGTVGGALAGMAYGVSGEVIFREKCHNGCDMERRAKRVCMCCVFARARVCCLLQVSGELDVRREISPCSILK